MARASFDPAFPNMRRLTQVTDSHCGPAVLAMLLSYLDIHVGQGEIAAAAEVEHKLEEHGMNIQEMKKAIQIIAPEATFWYKDKSTKEELDYLLHTKRYPVGVEWQGIFYEYSDEDDGHYSIVVDIDIENDQIFIADPFEPFSGGDREFKLHKFLKRWWDVNEIINPATGNVTHLPDDQMMFIITPKEETFPIELGMKNE